MAGGRQQEGGGNTEATAFVAIVLAILGVWLLWTFLRAAIVLPAFALDYAAILAVEQVRGLGETGQQVKSYVASFFDGRRDASQDISFAEFSSVRTLVGSQTNIVIAGAIAAIAAVIMFKMKGAGFRRRFTLGGGKGQPSFAHFQAGHWRTATYSANFDPDGRDRDIKPAATPLEWLRDNGIEYEDSMLDRDACEQAFAAQLGKRWHGLARADLHVQCVAVLCALHCMRHKAALPEREAVNIAWACGRDGTEAMKAVVAKYSKDPKVSALIEKTCSKHAFANTAIFALLDKARASGGVLASADFGYVKRIDRHFWYAINNVGRRRFHTEGAGAVNHYFAERVSPTPVPEPHVEQAIDGLEDYLAEQGIMSVKEFFARAEPED